MTHVGINTVKRNIIFNFNSLLWHLHLATSENIFFNTCRHLTACILTDLLCLQKLNVKSFTYLLLPILPEIEFPEIKHSYLIIRFKAKIQHKHSFLHVWLQTLKSILANTCKTMCASTKNKTAIFSTKIMVNDIGDIMKGFIKLYQN